jgi:hypothetical protein
MYDAYETAFAHAQSAWEATSAPGYFSLTSSSDPEINVKDTVYQEGSWAKTTWSCSGGLYFYSEVTIEFDTVDMVQLSAYERKIVAEHELGHAYGLWHMSAGCHVMRQGSHKFTCGSMPSSNDVDGVRARYSLSGPVGTPPGEEQ